MTYFSNVCSQTYMESSFGVGIFLFCKASALQLIRYSLQTACQGICDGQFTKRIARNTSHII